MAIQAGLSQEQIRVLQAERAAPVKVLRPEDGPSSTDGPGQWPELDFVKGRTCTKRWQEPLVVTMPGFLLRANGRALRRAIEREGQAISQRSRWERLKEEDAVMYFLRLTCQPASQDASSSSCSRSHLWSILQRTGRGFQPSLQINGLP